MRRWFWWFLLIPQGFLLVGFLQDLGLPPLNMAVCATFSVAVLVARCGDRSHAR